MLIIIVKLFLAIIAFVSVYIVAAFLYAELIYYKRPIGTLLSKRKEELDYVSLDELPSRAIEIILALEDIHFYSHKGFDYEAIVRAFKANMKAGHIIRGGSTITQQLVKNLYFNYKRSWFRKISELCISLRIEHALKKDDIMEMYINVIYFGNGQYGIADAAQFYFGKAVSQLTLNQTFFLICLLSKPTLANPYVYPEEFIAIRNKKINQVLWRDASIPQMIKSYGADNLDPELVQRNACSLPKCDKDILFNTRFGRSCYQ